jgi:hypothetical protein
MKHLLAGSIPVLALTFCLSSAAFGSVTFDFSNDGTGNLGAASKTFAPTLGSGPSITALGFGNFAGTTSSNLFFKNGGGGETGLGLVGTLDNEITTTTFIRLDLSHYIPPSQSITIQIGSDTSTEGFQIFTSSGSGAYGNGGSQVANVGSSANGIRTQTLTLSSSFIDIMATGPAGSNVLLDSFTITPEPGFYGALAVGFSGLMFAAARRRKQS